MPGNHTDLTLNVNHTPYQSAVELRRTLLDALRHNFGLTGAKKVCDMADCGTCTMLIDGRAQYAYLRLAVDCAGAEITTVEGLADAGELDPIQRAFIEAGAFQCGFCTPGQIMSLRAARHHAAPARRKRPPTPLARKSLRWRLAPKPAK